ncbi:MAG: DNA-binding protein WhiA [Firmicutes bacterium]|nr:DNA-binding protein WhiA [Bacillota bacterium]
MSFTAAIKSELCRLEMSRSCCCRAELAAFITTNGNLQLMGRRQYALNIVTEHAYIARRLYVLLKREFGIAPVIMVRKKARLRKNLSYLVKIAQASQAEEIVRALGIVEARNKRIEEIFHRPCCQRAYLRGCFLAGGSVSDPRVNGYHLEIATELRFHAENIRSLLAHMDLKSGIVPRKQQHVVYLKDSEQIATLLTLMGSHQGRLALENARIYKEIRNTVNRLVNCETANVNKTVAAAQRQVAAIKRLAAQGGLESLNPRLRQVARLRLEYPEASLEELGQAANPPLSKSAVNYRLRRLMELAGKDLTPREIYSIMAKKHEGEKLWQKEK